MYIRDGLRQSRDVHQAAQRSAAFAVPPSFSDVLTCSVPALRVRFSQAYLVGSRPRLLVRFSQAFHGLTVRETRRSNYMYFSVSMCMQGFTDAVGVAMGKDVYVRTAAATSDTNSVYCRRFRPKLADIFFSFFIFRS